MFNLNSLALIDYLIESFIRTDGNGQSIWLIDPDQENINGKKTCHK